MTLLYVVLLLLAAVCFILHTFGKNPRFVGRANLLSLGLFFWVLVLFIRSMAAVD